MADDENVIDVVVEIPRGSRNKNEFAEKTGALRPAETEQLDAAAAMSALRDAQERAD